MSDGITWLAEPKSIDWGGYSVVIAQDLAGEELARRVAATRFGRNKQEPRFIGNLTAQQTEDVMAGLFGHIHDAIALRHGEIDEWAFVVQHGFWYGGFGPEPPVSRGGAHVFHLWYEEENGKPVPPHFAYQHDGRTLSYFNLHLDGSWGYDGVTGDDRELCAAVEADLTAAGLPLDDPDELSEDRDRVHRTCLEVIERRFGLTLPRDRILDGALPTVLMKANVATCPFCGTKQS
ncbi:hypothetical protein [Streptomyces sp. NTH33]|uniref:hypothetical protein n=1 Tax=Streptomyces sp. NTH33 TaxID=1735453 RepID=UPI0011B93AB1|nr:hypothetical protein [Streptomyces sp. NTH33]